MTCKSNVSSDEGEKAFDEKMVEGILANIGSTQDKKLGKKQIIDEENYPDNPYSNNTKTLPLKFLISKKQLR